MAAPGRIDLALFLTSAVCLCLPAAAVHAGPLRDVDDAASRPAPARPSRDGRQPPSSSRRDSGWSSDEDEDEDGNGLEGILALWMAKLMVSPWTLPRTIMDRPELTALAAYPNARGPGFQRVAAGTLIEVESEVEPEAPGRPVAFAAALEAGYLIEGVVPVTLQVGLWLPARLELKSRVGFLNEVVGRAPERAVASLTTLAYRFAQSEHVSLRSGIGLRTFRLDRPRRGFDVLLYGMDVYGRRRGIARIDFHVGVLDNAFVWQVQASAGATVGRVELFAGYDHTNVAGTTLSGPCVGARAFW